MNGFLLINKQKGDSSFDVIRKLRKITHIKKMGHAGTLDPLADGLMIIAINEATKLLQYILKNNKTYKTSIEFGKTSETLDSEGPINTTDQKTYTQPTKEDIKKTLTKNFTGKIKQIPPKYSALKINGKKACDLIRKGKEKESEIELILKKKERNITIYKFKLIEYKWPNATFEIKCSTGTYIRTLISDLGKKLKCGAYIKTLTRTKIQNNILNQSIKLTESTTKNEIKKQLITIEEFTEKMQKIEIKDIDMHKFTNGRIIETNNAQKNYTKLKAIIETNHNTPILATYKNKIIGILNIENLKKQEIKLKKKILT